MLINYKCNLCSNEIDKLVQEPKDIIGAMPCGSCGGWLERQLSAPTSSNSEKIDPGNTTKPVYFDAERHKLAREQGDVIIRKQKEQENANEEKK